ncbi:hypothetical protein XELAEV_18046586mg [Xenopus laevis]|uniref:Uncharacterized protein n=1 Tax=Xenopus laevis TaxID=8355 RepID=A0A974BTL6_XENLA|nr:hypothetical protein XELAEV_18046586mg [Xenopus laevis]
MKNYHLLGERLCPYNIFCLFLVSFSWKFCFITQQECPTLEIINKLEQLREGIEKLNSVSSLSQFLCSRDVMRHTTPSCKVHCSLRLHARLHPCTEEEHVKIVKFVLTTENQI